MKRAYRVNDVRAAEAPLLDAGKPLMEHAAWAVSQAAIKYLRERDLRIPGTSVLALVGAGNNGGDTLFAAANLARRGLTVTALCCADVHEDALQTARSAGVRIVADPDIQFVARAGAEHGIWLDGLLGIGARGALREPLAGWVRALNCIRDHSPADIYVIAVDVPSGVGVDDGTVPDSAVLRADMTVTMGAGKRALYLPPACHYAGEIVEVPLGFERYLPVRPALVSLTDADVRDVWTIPGVDDHKYTRGVVGVLAGSPQYPGAGILAVAGARSIGAGMVRYCGEVPEVAFHFPDVVCARGRVQAWTLGSGLMDLGQASDILQESVKDSVPIVLDAGAVELVYGDDVPSTVVITPHEGELAQLLQARGEYMTRECVHQSPAKAARLAATLTGATVVLKGNVNVIAAPHGPLFTQGGAPAWLGTAGAGDVLAGMMGALLAMYGDDLQAWRDGRGLPAQLAAAACHIHARAAQIASRVSRSSETAATVGIADDTARLRRKTGSPVPLWSMASAGGSVTASVGVPVTAWDVAWAIPQALFEILNPQA